MLVELGDRGRGVLREVEDAHDPLQVPGHDLVARRAERRDIRAAGAERELRGARRDVPDHDRLVTTGETRLPRHGERSVAVEGRIDEAGAEASPPALPSVENTSAPSMPLITIRLPSKLSDGEPT